MGIRDDVTWSENKDDYLPLRSVEGVIGGQMFWTGYYTTRSNYKGLVKETYSILAKVLTFMTHTLSPVDWTVSRPEGGRN